MSLVEYTMEGPVALITLNRPPVNALSAALVEDLDAAVAAAEHPAVRSVVVTGSPHFAAGADITEFRKAFEVGARDALANRLSQVARRMERLPKPVIAAVRGYALGGGLELAMAADFIYLAEDARVGQPEIKLGIIPGAGGTQRLARMVGVARARDIVYSGRFVEPDEALAIGLAMRVLPGEDLLPAARADAVGWAKGPTVALGAAKRAINEGLGLPIDEGLQRETEAFATTFATDDAREGVAAFLEKRDPHFTGR